MQWSTACPQWAEKIVARQPIIPPPLFKGVAEHAVQIFSQLKIVDAPGQPTFGEAAEPWVFDYVRAVFGAYNEDTGIRHINQFFLLIAKKNGKSTIAAGIMLTALIMNWRKSAELYMLGTTKEVADNAFKPIKDMIEADEELSAMMVVQTHIRTITHRGTKATIKVIAAESDTVSGKKTSFVLVDELHEFGKKRNAENMLLEIEGGLASRPEGFVMYLTTASEAPPTGVFKQKLDYARGVRDGRIDDNTFLPVMYEFPKDMIKSEAYLDLKNAYIPNPNLGKSVSISFLEQRFKQAKERGREALNTFLSKHLNVEVGLNLASDRWVGADLWQAAGTMPKTSLQELIDMSEVVAIGIDGGGLDDLLAITVLGRAKVAKGSTKPWHIWTHAWAADSVFARRKAIVPQLEQFQAEGDLTHTLDALDGFAEMAALCAQVKQSGRLHLIGVDNFKQLQPMIEALQEAGINEDDLRAISQGSRLQTAIQTTEIKLSTGGIVHQNQSILNWAVGNAKVEPRGNAIMITKQASGTAKIDPLMALLNAVELMSVNPAAKVTMADAIKSRTLFITA